jgi:hypothetical protein
MKDTTPQAVLACHELLRWLIPHLDKFPRVRRFTLGERLESVLLEVLEATVESAYTRNKQQSLQRANLRLEVARDLWRLSHESQAISNRSYEHGAKLMDDLGRQLGGWLRSLSGGALSP